MKKQFKLGAIGGGFMAQAILKGAILSDYLRPKKVLVADVSQKALDNLDYLGINTTMDCREVAENCEYILFSIKPQNFAEVAQALHGCPVEKIISIMAGVKKEKIRDALFGNNIRIARAMPNLPCSVGEGMTAVDLSDFASSPDDCEFISLLFEKVGNFLITKESKLNAVTGISGSGPAYVYMFIEGLIKAGIRQGLTEDEAKILAVSTVSGGAEMVAHSKDKTIDDLISAVCSKGGTTIQAVNSFLQDDLYGIIDRAVTACVKRAEELSE